MKKPTEDRFWAKVDKNAPSPLHNQDSEVCWLWTGALSDRGYGVFRISDSWVGAHVYSHEMHYGPVPEGLEVCHNCNVRHCVRPFHLRADSHASNMRDAANAGSMKGTPGFGEENGLAKLTWRAVEEIRTLYATGKHTQKGLASKFGVVHSTINRIVNNRIWINQPETA